MDKISISTYPFAPTDNGKEAQNICIPDIEKPDTSTQGVVITDVQYSYVLDQNCPNPIKDKTYISFKNPQNTYVSLKVFNVFGVEITELAGKEFISGNHTLEFKVSKLSPG